MSLLDANIQISLLKYYNLRYSNQEVESIEVKMYVNCIDQYGGSIHIHSFYAVSFSYAGYGHLTK